MRQISRDDDVVVVVGRETDAPGGRQASPKKPGKAVRRHVPRHCVEEQIDSADLRYEGFVIESSMCVRSLSRVLRGATPVMSTKPRTDLPETQVEGDLGAHQREWGGKHFG